MVFLIHQALDQAAAKFPEQEALCFNEHSLSYAELSSKTNTLACILIEQGVQRRDRVGIYMNKGLESIVALYAILKAGACYVPIDPSSSIARVAFIVGDCNIRVLFSQPSKTKIVEQLALESTPLQYCIGLEQPMNAQLTTLSWPDIANLAPAALPETAVIEQDLAYIIYTSGSTGEPKGIMHSHYSGLAYAKWVVHYYGFHRQDRFTNHAPLHFDMSTLDYFAPLLVGATTVIVPEVVTKLPASYAELLQQQRITIFFTVPLALIQLLTRGALGRRDLTKLRLIIYGGESMPVKHLRALMLTLPECHFNNMYGPAETNGCTCYDVPLLTDDTSVIPIGKTFSSMQTKVLDEQNQELTKADDIGELVVRGPSVMLGYWSREDLNQKSFYTEQIIPGIIDRYYRTGDSVQIDHEHNYIFLGRRDRQIKVRGYRVELDGIESCLLKHPQVQEAAVYTHQGEQDTLVIKAAVLLTPEHNLSTEELISFLQEKLPPYTVPHDLTIHSTLPRNSNGKINYLQLTNED